MAKHSTDIRTISIGDLAKELTALEFYASSLCRQLSILDQQEMEPIRVGAASYQISRRYLKEDRSRGPVHYLLSSRLDRVRATIKSIEEIMVSTVIKIDCDIRMEISKTLNDIHDHSKVIGRVEAR